MFDSSSIIVGLEIGTSKVCAVVGEMNSEGALNIVGLGQSLYFADLYGPAADLFDTFPIALIEAR